MAHAICCSDCRAPRFARNRNTKYCHHCRLLRNVEFFLNAHSHRTCVTQSCSKTYAPIDRADEYCGACTLGYSTMRGECRVCHAPDAFLARPGVAVCKVCARDPAKRRMLVRSLQKGQAERRLLYKDRSRDSILDDLIPENERPVI